MFGVVIATGRQSREKIVVRLHVDAVGTMMPELPALANRESATQDPERQEDGTFNGVKLLSSLSSTVVGKLKDEEPRCHVKNSNDLYGISHWRTQLYPYRLYQNHTLN